VVQLTATSQRARVPRFLAATTIAVAGLLGAAGALLVHSYRLPHRAPTLPALHGEATWLPGSRPAPPPTHPGRTSVVAFVGGGCGWCLQDVHRVVRRLPVADRPEIVLPPPGAAARYGVKPGRRVLVLVDKNGDERTGYAFPFVPPFVEGDLRTLAAERR
jgi:hypothetical protein